MTADFKKLLGYGDEKKFTKGKTGLDLLKERFGHSASTHEKGIDNKEKIHEKLHDKFNFDDVGNIKSLGEQHQKQLDEKLCEIKYGDYIGYRDKEDSMKFWTVVDDGKIFSDNEHTVFGYKGATRTVQCTTADPNEFIGI